MKKLKVLLLNPFNDKINEYSNIEDTKKYNGHLYAEIPLGLLYIYTYVKNNIPYHDYLIFDAQAYLVENYYKGMEFCWSQLLEQIKRFNPDIIGLGAYFIKSAELIHETCKKIKNILPNVIIVAGGNYATITPETALKDTNIDYIIKSEGEKTFAEFIQKYSNSNDLNDIDGICFRTPKGDFNISDKKNYIKSLSDMPIPDRSVLPMHIYGRGRNMLDRIYGKGNYRIHNMTISRGCPYICTFCTSKEFWNRTIRYRDTNDVLDEMEILKNEYGATIISINDDNFMSNKKKSAEIMQGMIKRKLNLKWLAGGGSGVRAFNDDNYLDLAINSGYCLFNLAFESGSNNTLKKIKKPVTVEESIELVKKIRKLYPNIWVNGFFIVGFPFETKDDIIQTLEFSKYLELDWSSHYLYQAIPGSELYKYCVDNGLIDKTFIGYKENFNKGRINGIDWDAQWAFDKNYEYNLRVNFIYNRNLKNGNYLQALRDFEYVIDMVQNHPLAYRQASISAKHLGIIEKEKLYKKKELEILQGNTEFKKWYKVLNINKQ